MQQSGIATLGAWTAGLSLALIVAAGSVYVIGLHVLPTPERVITVNGEQVSEDELAEVRREQLKGVGKGIGRAIGHAALDGVRGLLGKDSNDDESAEADAVTRSGPASEASLIDIRYPDRGTTVAAGRMFWGGVWLGVAGFVVGGIAWTQGDKRHRVFFAMWPLWAVWALVQSLSSMVS